MNSPVTWTDFGVGIAAIVANLYIVLAFLRFLGNHLSKLTESIDELRKATERLADMVSRT